MDFNIDPKAINEYIGRKLIESSIGEVLQAAIDEQVKGLKNTWDRTYSDIVRNHMHKAIEAYVDTHLADEIRAEITRRLPGLLTTEFVETLVAESLKKLTRGY